MPNCCGSDGGVVYPDTGVYPDDADADAEEDEDDDDDADEGKKQAGLFVGPAIGCVGAQVFDNVTTRLRPSHPVDDNRSISISWYTDQKGVNSEMKLDSRYVRHASSSFFTIICPKPVGNP